MKTITASGGNKSDTRRAGEMLVEAVDPDTRLILGKPW
jgi:hypothetical protein